VDRPASSVFDAPQGADEPFCPGCGYLLTALVSRTCPECGLRLADDLSIYRPSRRPTPWSAAEPLNLLRGISWVVRRPIRTLAYGENSA
jgi:predicted amidophosphoribosyltransferase